MMSNAADVECCTETAHPGCAQGPKESSDVYLAMRLSQLVKVINAQLNQKLIIGSPLVERKK